MRNELEYYVSYVPKVKEPEDFSQFWMEGLTEDLRILPEIELKQIKYPLIQVEVFEACVRAGDGLSLKGWYVRPKDRFNLPGLVRFHGYSGNRGQISELLFWALQGYAVLGMDVRGQCGETPDGRIYSQGHFAGWMTQGVYDPQDYYLRQVYLDAVRLAISLGRQPEVNEDKLGVFGKSQGGGLALITAALINKGSSLIKAQSGNEVNPQIKAVCAGIPFLCDFPLAYTQAQDGPLAELTQYFRYYDPEHKTFDHVFNTLSYFDGVNFAPWIDAPVLFSVGLKDTACPPQTIFGVYNLIVDKKEIAVYPDYGHETIDAFVDRQIAFFARELLD